MIPVSVPSITDLEREYVNKAVESTWISSIGEFVDEFESETANLFGNKYAVATSSGTTALHLALLASGVKKGDKVGLPRITFAASLNAILYCDATPVIIDCDDCCLLDLESFEDVSGELDYLLLVHLNGMCCDLNSVIDTCNKKNIILIEDCAESIGSKYLNKPLGSFGLVSASSFYGNKILTTGEGGCVTTNSKEIYEQCKLLRDHAMSKEKKYFHLKLGYNYRMTNVQAAIGVAQLERKELIFNKRLQLMATYKEVINSHEDDAFEIIDAKHQNSSEFIPWLAQIRFRKDLHPKISEISRNLSSLGVDSRPMFVPMDSMPYIKYDKSFSNNGSGHIFLPFYYDLSEKDIVNIVKSLKLSIENVK